MNKYILKNGLISLFYPIDRAYSVSISLNIRAGVITESIENNGITHLLEHLHFRRLESMTQKELYYNMDIIGGNLYGETYKEMLRFKIKVRPKYLYDALFIFKNILKTYNWTEEDLETEKEIILKEIREKDCYFDFDASAHQILLKDTKINMPIIGRERILLNFNKDDIISYKKSVFTQNDVALVIVGGITEKDQNNINAYFEDIIFENRPIVQTNGNIVTKSSISILEYDIEYISCIMSFRVINYINKYELNLLNSVLGGGQSSLLQREIKENSLLSYDIYSYIEVYSDFSMINICFSVDSNNLCTCIEKIVDILNSLKTNINEREMKSNMTYYTENMWYLLENPQLLNEELSWEIFAGEEKTIEERIQIYERIDNAHLSDVARKIFNSANCSCVVMGKRENISQKDILRIIESLSAYDNKTP